MIKRRMVLACVSAILLVCAPAFAEETWNPEGRVVQFADSHVDLTYVRSDWTSQYDAMTHGPGPISFNDCAAVVNRANVPIAHIQLIFAAVDEHGLAQRPALPVDIRFKTASSAVGSTNTGCRRYGYANGDQGLWLIAWVNRVDFADGTSWSAPSGEELNAAILEALPHSLQF